MLSSNYTLHEVYFFIISVLRYKHLMACPLHKDSAFLSWRKHYCNSFAYLACAKIHTKILGRINLCRPWFQTDGVDHQRDYVKIAVLTDPQVLLLKLMVALLCFAILISCSQLK